MFVSTATTTNATAHATRAASASSAGASDQVVAPFRFFHVRVARIERLSPTFRRIAFVGADLTDWAHGGRDQRIKILTPSPSGKLPLHLLGDADWWGKWRELPPEDKAPMRTYTGRAFNYSHQTDHGADEIVVDFAVHGDHGPASRWVSNAQIGHEAVLVGPSVRGGGRDGGVEWNPPSTAKRLILAGDETAAPAICSIIEHAVRSGALMGREPADIRAFIEVPVAADRLPCEFADHPRVKVTWLAREDVARGMLLSSAVKSAVTSSTTHECSLMCQGNSCIMRAGANSVTRTGIAGSDFAGLALEDINIESEVLWDVHPHDNADDTPGCYAWIAGEAGVVKGLRRHLVSTLGMDRRAVAFMGYWREGRAELS